MTRTASTVDDLPSTFVPFAAPAVQGQRELNSSEVYLGGCPGGIVAPLPPGMRGLFLEVTMARMLGKVESPWCPICKTAPGLDCPDAGRSKRQVKRAERREWIRETAADLVK